MPITAQQIGGVEYAETAGLYSDTRDVLEKMNALQAKIDKDSEYSDKERIAIALSHAPFFRQLRKEISAYEERLKQVL